MRVCMGAKGHQIVALIAEAHLDAGTREKIKAILPKNGMLAKVSIWPDELRKALPQMNPLHYVDVPRGATAYDRDRDCPQRNCIVEAVTWYLNVLKFTDNSSKVTHRLITIAEARGWIKKIPPVYHAIELPEIRIVFVSFKVPGSIASIRSNGRNKSA